MCVYVCAVALTCECHTCTMPVLYTATHCAADSWDTPIAPSSPTHAAWYTYGRTQVTAEQQAAHSTRVAPVQVDVTQHLQRSAAACRHLPPLVQVLVADHGARAGGLTSDRTGGSVARGDTGCRRGGEPFGVSWQRIQAWRGQTTAPHLWNAKPCLP